MPVKPLKVFISYSHNAEDAELLRKLRIHLDPCEKVMEPPLFEIWDDTHLKAGDPWDQTIRTQVAQADIVLLLVSADFNASRYINEVEMQNALQRRAQGTCSVVGILLRQCDFQMMPYAQFEMLPKTAKGNQLLPVRDAGWGHVDDALTVVVKRLKELAGEILGTGYAAAAPVVASNHNFYNRKENKKPFFRKHALTVNRTTQNDEFTLSTQNFQFPKLHLYFLHGDDRQELQKMIERFEWEHGGTRHAQGSAEHPDSGVITINMNSSNEKIFLIEAKKNLLASLQCPEYNINKHNSLASFVSEEGKLPLIKGKKAVFVVCDIYKAAWDDVRTPKAIQYFIDEFLLSHPLPGDAPDFYFFFGVQYEKQQPQPGFLRKLYRRLFLKAVQNKSTNKDIAERVARVMQNHPMVLSKKATLLPKLEPPSFDDIEYWFNQHVNLLLPPGEIPRTYTQRFIQKNGLNQAYNDMVDLQKHLGELIDNYNNGIFL